MTRIVLLAALGLLLPAVGHAARPDRVWGTYVGTASIESENSIAVDGAGDIYLCGASNSPNGLATPGAYQMANAGTTDGFLVKFAPDGSRLWSTYFGGPGDDRCHAVAAGDLGVVVGGETMSTTGIATSGALQESHDNGDDGYVIAFDPDGQRLWGTYIGGPNFADAVNALAVDGSGAIHAAGTLAGGLAYPLIGGHDTTFEGDENTDAFLIKLSADGEQVWGTYYGAGGGEEGRGVAVDGNRVSLVGRAGSDVEIATPGVFDEILNSGDGFLVRFTASGVRQWGTYVGGEEIDIVHHVAHAPNGGVAVSGTTNSKMDVASPGAHQVAPGGMDDVFVAHFDGAGGRDWASYVGGTATDRAGGVAVDPAGNVIVAGHTSSLAGIATPDGYLPVYTGTTDAFLVKFDPAGVRRWGTYYGGPGGDAMYHRSLVLDGPDTLYLASDTNSISGIASMDAFQPMLKGGFDGFLVRFTQGVGAACADDSACEAGFCVDGVCCDSACGDSVDDCQVCSAALGATADGVCTLYGALTCRPAASECDMPELCSGVDPECPVDVSVEDDTPCTEGMCVAGVCTPPSSTTSGTTSEAMTTGAPESSDPSAATDSPTSASGSTSGSGSDSDSAPISTSDASPTDPGDPGATDSSSGEASSADTAEQTDPGGCGCVQAVPRDSSLVLLTLLALARRRRR